MFLTLSYINSGLNFKPLRDYRIPKTGREKGARGGQDPYADGRVRGPDCSM